jgi:hypothetical protein
MTDNTIKTVRLTLNNSPYCGKITCGMEAFFDFSFEMAEELEDLVAQHKHDNSTELRDRVGRGNVEFLNR